MNITGTLYLNRKFEAKLESLQSQFFAHTKSTYNRIIQYNTYIRNQ
jgi:hypothetical protein